MKTDRLWLMVEDLLASVEKRHAELSKEQEPEPRGGYAPWAHNIGRIAGQLTELERFRDELYYIRESVERV